MFTVTDNTTQVSSSTNGSPYADALVDLQLPFTGITDEYVDLTGDDLFIATDMPSFIQSGTGNDIIVDNSETAGDVVIDPGSGANTIQASSNPDSHDTIIVDAESDAPLIDVITGLKTGDNVVIKGVTELSANDFTDTTFDTLPGLMATTNLLPDGPAAQTFLSGYTAGDLADGGRLSVASFIPDSSMPEASPYLLLQVTG